jgi:hypothetical protein
MEPEDELEALQEQEIRVQKDLNHLSRFLNGRNLRVDIMFSRRRGIRSCLPAFETFSLCGVTVRERLSRVQAPVAE